ncbi:MAG: lytic transglycosylase domain-containing protein [Burkholderiales bacterium]|nr:lytic transglycosylase domain-containing protein [Burkholderiales bacterium]
MEPATLLTLLLSCAPHVDPSTGQALVAIESSLNPHAIGVVGGTLHRQPRNRREALATALVLREAGWNFSVGLAQINVRNLHRLQLSLDSAFDPCRNLAAMQTVLVECFERSASAPQRAMVSTQQALRKALSCYYSGNLTTGFEHGYVRRVALQALSQR